MRMVENVGGSWEKAESGLGRKIILEFVGGGNGMR